MLHRVDGNRDDLHGPLLARPHQRHWNSHCVIDQHFLTYRHVKLVSHERVDEVPGKLRVAGNRTRYRNAPAFVLVAVFPGGADCKGWQLVKEEIETVIVVEDHSDVELFPRKPVVHIIEALEEWLPIRDFLLSLGDRLADRGNVGGRYAADDGRHAHLPPATSFALKASTLMPVCCAPISCTFSPKMPASFAR